MKQKKTIAQRLAPKVKSVVVNQEQTRCLVIKEEDVKKPADPRQLKLF